MLKFKSLTAKLIFIGGILLAFFAAYAAAGYIFTHHISGEAKRINLAGRQRMLTLGISYQVKSYLASPQSPEKEMFIKNAGSRMAEYEEALYGLRDGSKQFGLRPMPERNRESISQLNTLIELWSKTQKPALLDVLKLPPERKNEACGMCHSAIRDKFPKVEALVKSLEMYHEKETKDFDAFRLYAFGILFVGVVFVVFYIRQSIIRPMWKLRGAAKKMGEGSFDVRVEVKSEDEIGRLSESFNQMAQTLEMVFDEKTRLLKNLNDAQRIAHLGNWDWDIVKNTLYWSDETYRIFGLSPQEFGATYEAFLNAVHPDDREFVKNSVNDALYEGKPYSIDHRIVLPDGAERIVHEQAEVPFDETGKLIRMVGTVLDITERKKIEEQLREYAEKLDELVKERTRQLVDANFELQALNRELELRRKEAEDAKQQADAANRAKSDFLANMSHELRTPLNSIIGFSDILADGLAGPVSEEQKDLINDISTSGKHLLSLINDILDLSKVEAGKMELEPEEFNLEELIDGSLVMFKEKAMKHNIKVAAEIEAGIGNIIADERKIKQVLFNLLSNALKFTPDGGSVRVSARRVRSSESGVWSKEKISELITQHSELDRNFLEISVADTGIGISPEDQKILFQPFQQIDSVLSKKYSGTGLGLNLCKKFVELHGGRIWMESEVGKGSKFIFVIPSKGKPSTEKIVDPVTKLLTWEHILTHLSRILSFHKRTVQGFGLMRMEVFSDKPVDYAALAEILKKAIRKHEVLGHGESHGWYYVILLEVDRQMVDDAVMRMKKVLADKGYSANTATVIYPDDGENKEELLKVLGG